VKTATVALIIRFDGESPSLAEIVSDDQEIEILELAFSNPDRDPMAEIQEHRRRIAREDDEFGDYVEQLLSQPFVKPEIQEHGVEWLKSRIRIEQFQKTESAAAKVIGDYAYRLFSENRGLKDFFLSGPNTRVRVRIFVLPQASSDSEGASRAA
jgi:hypothetical protein